MNRFCCACVMTVPFAAAALGVFSTPAGAQGAGDSPRPGEVATEPIRCWWRTDRPAVHVGERFTLALTCRVIETSAVTVVPAVAQLDPGAVQLTPFEATGGERREDILAPPWRYFQYEYTVRFMGEGMFGQDAIIPPLTVTYNVQAASGGGVQGRDQGYVLPALPIRIASLAPREAVDIRDASADTFAALQAQRFRATAALVAAGVFFGFAAVLVGLAGVRAIGRTRRAAPAVVRAAPVHAVLRGCRRALQDVKADVARDGWSPALARRAASVLRVAGAVALGQPVTQTPCDRGVRTRDGQLVLRHGTLRPRRAVVSAPITPLTLERHLGNGHEPGPRARATIQQVLDALQVFSAVAYGRNGHVDTAALDSALDQGASSIRRLRVTSLWPVRAVDAVRSRAGI